MAYFSRIIVVLSLGIAGMSCVQAHAADQAEVKMIGTSHFSSPGREMVKIKHLDVMNAPSQSFLEAFAAQLATDSRIKGVDVRPPIKEANLARH